VIEELRITDLGVINDATIALHPGFTVVTGETGAGKTMVVTGIGLLLGGRADPRAVRNGADRARVEGRFRDVEPALAARVEDAGGQLDDGATGPELLVARHLTAAGRSRAYLGGAGVPAAVCAEVTSRLITIHGQSEQVRLAAPDRQREILDRFAGPRLAELLTQYRARYAERRSAVAELTALRDAAQARAREADLLAFGLAEIETVAPEPGEDVALAAEAERLQSADDLRLVVSSALAALAGSDDEAGGAMTGVGVARKALDGQTDTDIAALAGRLAEVGYALGDVAADLARYLDRLDAEPGRLEWIAARRAALQGLTRKYGNTVEEVLAWSADAAARLATLDSSDERIAALAERTAVLDGELADLAGRITAERARAATAFSERVLEELAALAMPHARLVFALTTGDLGPHGADSVELLFSANPGSEPRSLAKVASGGELSRVRLALEVVLAAGAEHQTLVFDEVDAGVGGRSRRRPGRRLAALARHAQVVVVTHLAQVAAFADQHYVVVKADDGQVTTSGVLPVAEEERAAELARMMAGLETTDSALAHAGELVELAEAARRPD
jgi:DNA repair protein RecN (Recombination protein N)